jgi:hypothetical protein
MCMCYGAIIARNSSVYVAHIKFWFMNNLHASVKPSLPGPSGMTVSTWEVCSVWEWHGFYTTPHSWESPQQSTHSNEQFTSLVLVFCFLLIFDSWRRMVFLDFLALRVKRFHSNTHNSLMWTNTGREEYFLVKPCLLSSTCTIVKINLSGTRTTIDYTRVFWRHWMLY